MVFLLALLNQMSNMEAELSASVVFYSRSCGKTRISMDLYREKMGNSVFAVLLLLKIAGTLLSFLPG